MYRFGTISCFVDTLYESLVILQVPLLDGSAKEWVEAIEHVGLCAAEDSNGNNMDKLVAELHVPVYLWRDGAFIVAFPSSKIHITYGIDFPKVHFHFFCRCRTFWTLVIKNSEIPLFTCDILY